MLQTLTALSTGSDTDGLVVLQRGSPRARFLPIKRLLDPANHVSDRDVVRPPVHAVGRPVLLNLLLPLVYFPLGVLALEDVHGLRDQGFHADPHVDVDVVPVELGVQHKHKIVPVADSRGALLTAVRISV